MALPETVSVKASVRSSVVPPTMNAFSAHNGVPASAGVACGLDALFMEVHDDPKNAASDGPNACPLSELARILERLVAIERAVSDTR